jgi:hypothetical protein
MASFLIKWKAGYHICYISFSRRRFMTAISLLILVFVCVGLFSRSYNSKVRLLVLLTAVSVVIYITIKP